MMLVSLNTGGPREVEKHTESGNISGVHALRNEKAARGYSRDSRPDCPQVCIRFLGRKKSKFITIPLALEWSQQSKNVQRSTWARKLSMVRQFARWLSVIEPRHQVPPPRLLNVRHRRNKLVRGI